MDDFGLHELTALVLESECWFVTNWGGSKNYIQNILTNDLRLVTHQY